MSWIEIIRLQAACGSETQARRELELIAQSIVRNSDCPGLVSLAIYRQAVLQGSFELRLNWCSAIPQTEGSKLGLSLLQLLKRYGLTSHSIWLEIRSEKQ